MDEKQLSEYRNQLCRDMQNAWTEGWGISNHHLSRQYQELPDTRTRYRKVLDEAAHRICGAWDCLMGRGE